MEKEEENNFRKLIKNAGTSEAPANFMSIVMRSVQESTQKQIATDALLVKILQESALEKPSVLFNQSVFASLKPYESKRELPIIGKWIWYLMAASLAGILLLGLLFPDGGQQSPAFIPAMDNLILDLVPKINALPAIYPLTLVAISVLFLLDNGIRQRFLNRTQRI